MLSMRSPSAHPSNFLTASSGDTKKGDSAPPAQTYPHSKAQVPAMGQTLVPVAINLQKPVWKATSAIKRKAEPLSRDCVLPQSPQGNSKSYRPRSAQEHLYKTKHSPWTGSAWYFKDILGSGRGGTRSSSTLCLTPPMGRENKCI